MRKQIQRDEAPWPKPSQGSGAYRSQGADSRPNALSSMRSQGQIERLSLVFNSFSRIDHWHGESECEPVAKLGGWCSGLGRIASFSPVYGQHFRWKCSCSCHTTGRSSKVLVPVQSLCTNDMDEYLSAHCEPYLRVQDPQGLVESRFMHLLFLCTRSTEPLATTCAGRRLIIMDRAVSSDESLVTFIYRKRSLSISHVPGSVHGGDTAGRRSRPGSQLGFHSSKGSSA